ncbi:MAG: hypothetical protein DMF61_14705 [Blastocatellia bacterium AA13]|nr:MAG: hypothetical protein DMF61_14705 [Blastocatellia bacterium AA13]
MSDRKSVGSRAGERGAVSIKAILSIGLALAALFVVIKIVPVYWDEQQVKHQVDELARITANQNLKPEKISKRIEEIRSEFNLPEDSIMMTAVSNQSAQFFLKYSVTIDFIVSSYVWKVDYVTVGRGL